MDFNILEKIMKNELKDMKINEFENWFNGTIKLAEHYLYNRKNCSYILKEKNLLEMFYKERLFGSIKSQTPSTNKKEGIRLANNKMEAEKLLKSKGLPTTDSVLFSEKDYDRARILVENSKVPMVIKPYNLNAGRGITLNVDASNFTFAWKYAKQAYEDTKKQFNVLLQPMVAGIEVRMLIIEGKFNSAVLRVPANITGDGKSTIVELIDKKNNSRKLNPHLKMLPIKINDMVLYTLKKKERDLDFVSGKGEVLFLHSSSNISLGGDSIEVSHLVNDSMKKTAELAVKSIPGLETAGVDLLFTSFEDNSPVVLELNPGANLKMHHYPLQGEPKQPVFDMIEDMISKAK